MMTSIQGRIVVVGAAVAALALSAGGLRAAQQTLAGKKAQVKNLDPGGDTSRRKIVFLAKEKHSDNTLVGDPTGGGAKLRVRLGSQSQCFSMPAGGWTAISSSGFKYRDRQGLNGPVKAALVKRTAGGGVFLVKVIVLGNRGPGPQPIITVTPPGAQLDGTFSIGAGDEYCATFGGTIQENDARMFKAKDAPDPGSCAIPVCSASGAFLDASSAAL